MKKVIVITVLMAFIVTGVAYAGTPTSYVDWGKGKTWPAWLDTKPEAKAQIEQAIKTDLLVGTTVKGKKYLNLNKANTRAEFAALLGRVLNLGDDKGTLWYINRVQALVAKGIIPSNTGNWNAAITRQEMGLWMGRAVVKFNCKVVNPDATLPDIVNNADILNAVRAGVISGYNDGKYHGERTAQRVEGMLMLVRLQNGLPETPGDGKSNGGNTGGNSGGSQGVYYPPAPPEAPGEDQGGTIITL